MREARTLKDFRVFATVSVLWKYGRKTVIKAIAVVLCVADGAGGISDAYDVYCATALEDTFLEGVS